MRILVASQLDPTALLQLQRDHDVRAVIGGSEDALAAAVGDREAIVFRSGVTISNDVLAAGPNLRLLVRAGSGLDNLDLDYVRSRGITLHRIPGPGAQAVAELTFGLMICLARGILRGDRNLREGHWIKSELVGYNLTGKTLGIVGLGSIGSRVAALGAAWGMRTIGCVAHYSAERAERLAERGFNLVDLGTVLEEGDFVTVHVPLDETTHGLIGRAELARMKPGSYLVNAARGGVVDEGALFEALVDGSRLKGAALDVHANEGEGRVSPLVGLPNVVLTPHIGATTVDAQREIGREVIRLIEGHEAESRQGRMAQVAGAADE
jgi:D-3-phosphoglycerate dehydrogenase / 2-oxoglutarate reductase